MEERTYNVEAYFTLHLVECFCRSQKNIYIGVEVSEILIIVSIIKKWHCIKG